MEDDDEMADYGTDLSDDVESIVDSDPHFFGGEAYLSIKDPFNNETRPSSSFDAEPPRTHTLMPRHVHNKDPLSKYAHADPLQPHHDRGRSRSSSLSDPGGGFGSP